MPLFFTHIPKTAGTSFKLGVIFPNVGPDKVLLFNGIKRLVLERGRSFDFLDGHYPYGIHRFCSCPTPPVYLTMLREPLDRAISHYYFIKQCDREDYQHPDLGKAKKWDIAGFYRLPQFQNLQTKYTAGLLAMKMLDVFPRALPESLLLARAKYNLANNYHLVGLMDRLSEFEELVARRLGWRTLPVRDHSKTTVNRPRVDSVDETTKAAILRGNRLDVELYQFAQKLVAERLERPSATNLAVSSVRG